MQCSNGNNKPKVSNLQMSLDCVDSLMVESQNHISDVKTDERRRKIEGKQKNKKKNPIIFINQTPPVEMKLRESERYVSSILKEKSSENLTW